MSDLVDPARAGCDEALYGKPAEGGPTLPRAI